MDKIIGIILVSTVLALSGCKKDKTCGSVSMTGERELFVGKWRWYSTTVERWYDIGPSDWYDYNPNNQGENYSIEISLDGNLKTFKNGMLIQEYIISSIYHEHYQGANISGISFNVDCTNKSFELAMYTSNITRDSIYIPNFPFDFDDQENHLKSHLNYFVKE